MEKKKQYQLNRITISGRLYENPKSKPFQKKDGSEGIMTMFDIVLVNNRYEKTAGIEVVSFGKVAQNVKLYCEKGSQVIVDGKLSFDRFTPEGSDKNVVIKKIIADEVHFIGRKKDDLSSDLKESEMPS